MSAKIGIVPILSIATLFFAMSCAILKPGADPIVVRTEQALTVGKSTFDMVLNVDHANRPFWRSNAPAFHAFCETLRKPVEVAPGLKIPTDHAMLLSLDDIKLQYKAGRATSNDLFTALYTFNGFLLEAQQWQVMITNSLVYQLKSK